MNIEKKEQPVLSVVIPIYKVEQYLETCVNSVLSQDYPFLEIILVDDGSPDSCPAMCDKLAKKDERIKVIHKENGGLSDARNTGIRAATGEYLAFLDSDDFWNGDASLNRIMQEVIRYPKDVYVYGCLEYYPDGSIARRVQQKRMCQYNKETVEEIYKHLIEVGDIFEAAYIKILKTSFFKSNNLYFSKNLLSEDNEWTFRVMRCAKGIRFIDEPLVFYRAQRPGSITNSVGIRNIQDLLKIMTWSEMYYKEKPEELPRIGKCELAHCAYLWFIALGIYGGKCLNKNERRNVKKDIKRLSYLTKYSGSRKTKLAGCVCNLLGISITSRLLNIYIQLNRKNIISFSRKKEK